MKILDDGTRVPESWVERRRLWREARDVIDEDWYRYFALCVFFDPVAVGDIYMVELLCNGTCVVPGCMREAAVFCDEHQNPVNRPGPLRADS